MLVKDLKKHLENMPDDAFVQINYEPELDLIDIINVYLTGFDEFNAVVSLETNPRIYKEDTTHGN